MLLRPLVLALACSILGASPKAIWVWSAETSRLLGDRDYEARVVALLRTQGFRTLYLYADDDRGHHPILGDRERYRALIGRLHGAGLRVEALLGSFLAKTWEGGPPEGDGPLPAMVQHVLDYNAAAPPGQRFDGAHLDIEPHALDTWNEATRVPLSRLFLARSAAWVALARKAAPGFVIGAAIPFWYSGFEVAWNGVTKPMNAHVQDLYDYVAVMDYRNRAEGPDGIIALAREEIAYGATLGKRVVLALETGEAEPAKVTFRHQGADALAREMGVTERAYRRSPAFSGFAIHHLRSWMELIETPNPRPQPLPLRP